MAQNTAERKWSLPTQNAANKAVQVAPEPLDGVMTGHTLRLEQATILNQSISGSITLPRTTGRDNISP
jgi:hypothetical protein